ncbi:acyl-CoA dehydrogenase family protein [Nonomuraea endophytica]|uniref:Alkylation response protein AidB-like acyl-CoA dehydrogenase n=1 Tax=Nonomuraea endophytica TaxID=714136 RepID=A0A7W8A9R1_9ACTN|nr:acyl-CoA dehydrogenase family protein [Nonomuraea endophytica]MBB5081171.1 alkylation response protein AidB-like acyl-CoA dehydrogenase [Nonomuraea endophytica]
MDEAITRALAVAAQLDRALADPMDERNPASFHAAVRADRDARFPRHLCGSALAWGLAEYLIPAVSGGRLTSLEEAFALFRVLARRDLTAATTIAASFLSALPVWRDGSQSQRRAVAGLLREHELMGLPVGEAEQGVDILAREIAAFGDRHAWRLDGRTSLIDNGSHAAGTTVLARTGDGPTTFLLLRGDGEHWWFQPAHEAHGLRGGALSRLTLAGVPAGDAQVVGGLGQGLATAGRTLPVARLLVAALALGALDTCLRAALPYAEGTLEPGTSRQGEPAVAGEVVLGRRLADAYADLLIGEAVCHELCRTAREDPHAFAAASARLACLAAGLAGDAVETLAGALGGPGYRVGIVEKMRRDSAVAGALADDQLPPAVPEDDLPPDPFVPVPPELSWLGPPPAAPPPRENGLAAAARVIGEDGLPGPHAPRLLELLGFFRARRSGCAHAEAAAACAAAWMRARGRDGYHMCGGWLLLCLRRLAVLLGQEQPEDAGVRRVALVRLRKAAEQRRLFSDHDVDLA